MIPREEETPVQLRVALGGEHSDSDSEPATLVFAYPAVAMASSGGADVEANADEPLTLVAPAHYPSSHLDGRHEVARPLRRALTPARKAPTPEPPAPQPRDVDATRVDLPAPARESQAPSTAEPSDASLTLATAAPELMSELPVTGAPEPELHSSKDAHSAPSRVAAKASEPRLSMSFARTRLLPSALVVLAALGGTLLGRLCVSSRESSLRTAGSSEQARTVGGAALGSSKTPATAPDAVPLRLVAVPAPHLMSEAASADAWLLGQREHARARYRDLVQLAPNARAYALVLRELEAPRELTDEGLGSPRVAPAGRASAAMRPLEVAVVVRSRGQAHVPVRLDGELVGDTGQAGVLHFDVQAPEGRELALELDTRDMPILTPPSPRRTVRIERGRPVLGFDVTFEVPRPPTKPKKRPPQRAAPYRMD